MPFRGQDQAFTLPQTCTVLPPPSPSQAEELHCVELPFRGQDKVFTLPHTCTVLPPSLSFSG